MDLDLVYGGENYFPKYVFSEKLLIKLKEYLLENVIGQDEAINSIINVFKSTIIRNSYKPLTILLSGPSGTGKSYIVSLISEFLQREEGTHKLYHIDLSKYFANETASFFGVSAGFNGSESRAIFEDVADIIYDEHNYMGTALVYLNELDKIKKNSYEYSAIDTFFKTTMDLFNNHLHRFKGGSKAKTGLINITNVIFFIDGNFIDDYKNGEYKEKIGFKDDEILSQDKDRFINSKKSTKKELLLFLEKNLGKSALSRINYSPDSIIQFNSLSDGGYDIKYKIFVKEFEALKKYAMSLYPGKKEILLKQSPTKELFNKMLGDLGDDISGRNISNYVNNVVKLDIIDKFIIKDKTLKGCRN